MKNFLVKTLLKANSKLVIDSAIQNCHVVGLHSFILNRSPKIRLFIADENCVLRQPFNIAEPILTIHAHKHNDIFVNLTKTSITHHIFKKTPIAQKTDNTFIYSLNLYNRLDAKESHNGMLMGDEYLDYIGSGYYTFLPHTKLHTVNILGNGKCAWLIMEVGTNENFVPVSYGGEQIHPECYRKFNDPIGYIKEYLEL